MLKSVQCRFSVSVILTYCALFLCVSALPILTPPVVGAQGSQILRASGPKSVLKGLTTEEITERFGQPDSKYVQSESLESWVYGKSMILFRESRVTAWSDAGELTERQNLAAISDQGGTGLGDSFFWVNEWTPYKPLKPDEVLEEILAVVFSNP